MLFYQIYVLIVLLVIQSLCRPVQSNYDAIQLKATYQQSPPSESIEEVTATSEVNSEKDEDENIGGKVTDKGSSLPSNLLYNIAKKDEHSILGRAVLTTPHRRMQAVRIAPGPRPSFLSPQNPGPLMVSEPILVTKFSLAESLGCAFRDLRVIDPLVVTTGNSRYSGPAFLARKDCVIVHVGHIRAIIMKDQALIFLPDPSSNNNEIIENLIQALVQHLNSIYHYNTHHLSFDNPNNRIVEDDSIEDVQLMKQGTIASGQHWGAGWYSSSSLLPVKRHRGNKRFGKNNPKRQLNDKSTKNILTIPPNAPPFELVIIEALLGHVCSHESGRVSTLLDTAKDVLEGISIGGQHKLQKKERKKDAFLQMQAKLGELLRLKNKVDEFESQCSELAAAIAEVLKNDEDMAAMRLSLIHSCDHKIPDVSNSHVEVELLFEDHLLQMDEVLHSLRSVQSSIRNTEEVLEIELDLLRNRIMKYEMLLELCGLVVGVAAAVTGAFGMNLVNHFEEHPRMFYRVSLGIILFMIAMGFGILNRLSIDNIL